MSKAIPPTPARTYAGYSYQCVTCEFPIDGKPTFHLGLAFCCAGCAVSGPCVCSYDDRVETVTDEPGATPVSEERVPVLV